MEYLVEGKQARGSCTSDPTVVLQMRRCLYKHQGEAIANLPATFPLPHSVSTFAVKCLRGYFSEPQTLSDHFLPLYSWPQLVYRTSEKEYTLLALIAGSSFPLNPEKPPWKEWENRGNSERILFLCRDKTSTGFSPGGGTPPPPQGQRLFQTPP